MRHKTLAFLAVVLLGLAGWGLHQRYEIVTETIDLGPGPLAQRDPMLAARRYLQGLGAEVAARDRLPHDAGLGREGTLIVAASSEVLTAGQAQRLLDWVADGGHLIVAAGAQDGDTPDPLLAPFGIVRRIAGKPEQEADVAGQLAELLKGAAAGRKTAPPDDEISELVFDGQAEPARVHFNPRFVLAEPGGKNKARRKGTEGSKRIYAAGSRSGIHFVQHEWGEGLVSVMSDLRVWHNDQIGRHDHAFLLQTLVDVEQPVLMLHGARVPDLLELLDTHAREAGVAAAVLLLAWLARRARRFGPLRAAETGERRALGEHILAASRYRWRQAGASTLLRGARDAVLERARRRLPELAHTGLQQQAQMLEEHSGLPADTLRQALHTDPGLDADALKRTTASLQSLWKKL